MIFGVTGIYCSGKNTVSKLIAEYGFKIIDVDEIGHKALEIKKDDIVREFGSKIVIKKDVGDEGAGKIDRKALGKIVFSDPKKLKKLESIVHPWMIKEVKNQVYKDKNCVINAALLIEMCLFVLCDYVIGVDIDEKIAVERAIKRDGLSREEAWRRIQRQIPLKEKKHYVDIVIENNGAKEDLEHEVLDLLVKLGVKVK